MLTTETYVRDDKKFDLPQGRHMPRTDETELLYELEETVVETINAAAEELRMDLDLGLDQLWTVAMPEELLSVLDSFEPGASIAAAIVFLRKHGFNVTENKPATIVIEIEGGVVTAVSANTDRADTEIRIIDRDLAKEDDEVAAANKEIDENTRDIPMLYEL